MKLNKRQKLILKEYGFSQSDFPQIERVITKTRYYLNNKRLNRNQVIKMIGEEEFLSGIGRSAFHYTSVRNNILFDSSKFFKDE